MPSTLPKTLEDFKNKKILIWGIGLNKGGSGAIELFCNLGAKVRATDLRGKTTLKPVLDSLQIPQNCKLELILGKHRKLDFKWADIIVRNPAIPPHNKLLQWAKTLKKPIVMEMVLYFTYSKAYNIGITGTKGKSTTTTLIHKILNKAFNNVHIAGNIGVSALKLLPKLTPNHKVVLELSSFQLDNMNEYKLSPNIAVLTNIGVDHINWHGSLKEYQKTKLSIFTHQSPDDYAVIPYKEYKRFKKHLKTKAKIIITGILTPKEYQQITTQAKPYAIIWYHNQTFYYNNKPLFKKLKLSHTLQGTPNIANILNTIAATYVPFEIKPEIIKKVLKTFKGLPGRLQLIHSVKNLDFYNDTAATNTTAVKHALSTLKARGYAHIIWIAGGVDKGEDYKALIELASTLPITLILFEGSASEKLKTLADQFKLPHHAYFNDINKAVQKAYQIAKSYPKNQKIAIILSPAAASFNMFLNEWDRGEKFEEAVRKIVLPNK